MRVRMQAQSQAGLTTTRSGRTGYAWRNSCLAAQAAFLECKFLNTHSLERAIAMNTLDEKAAEQLAGEFICALLRNPTLDLAKNLFHGRSETRQAAEAIARFRQELVNQLQQKHY